MRLKSFVPCLAVLAFVGCDDQSRASGSVPSAPANAPAVAAPATPAPVAVTQPVVGKAVAAVEAGLKPGLLGEYFEFPDGISDFPEIAAGTKPAVSRVDATISIEESEDDVPGTTLSEHFYVRWTGVLRVPKDGVYTITTASDDGSRVFINDKQVVDNGGEHPTEEQSGEVELKAGDHKLKVEFFENEGGASCILMWSATGLEQVVIPANAFFH